MAYYCSTSWYYTYPSWHTAREPPCWYCFPCTDDGSCHWDQHMDRTPNQLSSPSQAVWRSFWYHSVDLTSIWIRARRVRCLPFMVQVRLIYAENFCSLNQVAFIACWTMIGRPGCMLQHPIATSAPNLPVSLILLKNFVSDVDRLHPLLVLCAGKCSVIDTSLWPHAWSSSMHWSAPACILD